MSRSALEDVVSHILNYEGCISCIRVFFGKVYGGHDGRSGVTCVAVRELCDETRRENKRDQNKKNNVIDIGSCGARACVITHATVLISRALVTCLGFPFFSYVQYIFLPLPRCLK